MPDKPTHRLRRLSSLLLTLGVGCSGPLTEQEAPESFAMEANPLASATKALPPGLAPALVKDVQEGADTTTPFRFSDSRPSQLATVGSTTFFLAAEESSGVELWKTDGTEEGTQLVKEFAPGLDYIPNLQLVAMDDHLLVLTSDQSPLTVWRSDGAPKGTHPLARFPVQVGFSEYSATTTCGGLLFSMPTPGQLLRSDGTAEGTFLLDIPQASLAPGYGTACANGRLFFFQLAWGLESPFRLLSTDGTPEGTRQLAAFEDAPRAPWLTSPMNRLAAPVIAAVGETVFFTGHDFTHGFELWKSDGTPEGTGLVKDISSAPWGNPPQWLTAAGGTLFFFASDDEHGQELWKSDGTPEGTVLVTDLVPGPGSPWLKWVTAVEGTLFFSAQLSGPPELFKSDGTPEGTTWLAPLNLEDTALLPGNRLLFTSWDTLHGQRLRVSDGTAAGTTPLLEDREGRQLHAPEWLTRAGDFVLFTATDGHHGMELWRTDGTVQGTWMVKDIFPADSSSPDRLTDLEGTLFFTAYDSVHGSGLWKSDGTTEGTQLIKGDLGPHWAPPSGLTPVNTRLLFFTGSSQPELWRTDGTTEGTMRLAPAHGFSARSAVAMESLLFFANSSLEHGVELWKSDGTAEGTVLVRDIAAGSRSAIPDKLTRVGETFFFTADDGIHGNELWKSDGTPEGTVLVKDIYPARSGSYASHLVAVGDTLFFVASDGIHGRELWKSDGTAEGTVLVKDIHPARGYAAQDLMDMGDTLFFVADDGVHGRELWKSDGTTEGTVLVQDIVPGPDSAFPGQYSDSWNSRLHAIDGVLYFAADDQVHGLELWKSDGTAEGTVLVRDIRPGPEGSGLDGTPFVPVGPRGAFAFAASNGEGGMELWMSDGTAEGTRQLPDVAPGYPSASPRHLTVSGPRLFFVAGDWEHGRELWSVKQAAFTVP